MKKGIIFSILIILSISLSAQISDRTKIGLSISPSALVNKYPMLQLGIALQDSLHQFHVEYGYTSQSDEINFGSRIKIGLLLFDQNIYHYKTVTYKEFNFIMRRTSENSGDLIYKKNMYGISYGKGLSTHLGHNFYLQTSFGFGLGIIEVKEIGDPDLIDLLEDIIFFPLGAANYEKDGTHLFPIITANVKLIKTF